MLCTIEAMQQDMECTQRSNDIPNHSKRLAQRIVRVPESLKNRYSPWLPLRPSVSMEPMTRCTEVKIEYDPMHMSQPSKRIHGSQNGSYERNSLLAVPLRESFKDKIVIEKRCSPKQAILQQRRLERELGLVIDLTNNDGYCWKSDWTQEGIQYVKIKWLYGFKKEGLGGLEKDYNVLKRQFDNIKANNDVLKNHNKKLQSGEITKAQTGVVS
ncbi:mRNA-capping enzyme-like protein isoform X2 [Tanacetum coccineum]